MDEVKAAAAAAEAAPAPPAGSAEADAAAEVASQRASRLRALKREYKAAYDEMKAVQSDADYTSSLVEAATRELVEAFSAWCVSF